MSSPTLTLSELRALWRQAKYTWYNGIYPSGTFRGYVREEIARRTIATLRAENERLRAELAERGQWEPVEHEFSLGTLTTWDDGIEDGDGVSDWWVRINELAAPLYDVRLCRRTSSRAGKDEVSE